MSRRIYNRQKNDPWHFSSMQEGDEYFYTGKVTAPSASRAAYQFNKSKELRGEKCRIKIRKHPTDENFVIAYRIA